MAAFLTTVFLMIISSLTSTSEAGGRRGLPIIKKGEDHYSTAIYWGQQGKEEEGSLSYTCDQFMSGDIVIISGLKRFGLGQKPALNLTDHCDPEDLFGCTSLSRDIRDCQRSGIKVFLSIGGADNGNGDYGLESEEEAEELADYLWNNFLGGFSLTRPVGSAVLDGIDFDIEGGATDTPWDVLASELSEHKTFFFRQVLLSAAVQCSIPDPYLDTEVKTGVFDYIWVRFFGDESCEYNGRVDNLLKSWKEWSSYPGVNSLFLGIPERQGPGYISDEVLYDDIIPEVEKNPQFRGVLIWSLPSVNLHGKGSLASSPRANTTSVFI